MKNTFKKLFISFTVLSLTACGSTTMQDNTFAAKENTSQNTQISW